MSKIKQYLKLVVAVMLCTLMLWTPNAQACTGIMLRNADGWFVNGRTGEFGYFIDTDVVVIPRKYEFVGEVPSSAQIPTNVPAEGLKFTTQYASVGLIAFDVLGYLDGMNEKGLAFGAFYFPTFAKYPQITSENVAKALSPSQFGNWVLGQFATVAEVKEAIKNGEVVIANTPVEGFGDEAPPFHYVVYDTSCTRNPRSDTSPCINSIVIEPLNGELVVHDNPLGVVTNSPDFSWHMTNLRNYIALNALNVPEIKVNGTTFTQVGQGTGLLGLPGDFTPPSRFVRAAVFSASAKPSENAREGIEQVFHILNNFDIPLGAARAIDDAGNQHYDYTIITTARDPQSLRYYYKTYEDQTLRMVNLNQFDLDAPQVKKLKTNTDQPIINMSKKLQ